ncbi:MAG: hypothetical protein V2L15_04400, partial [Desulfobacteraceae bacterium]|nr:hypothetical protein [Desulfobacteraceae bacterium]
MKTSIQRIPEVLFVLVAMLMIGVNLPAAEDKATDPVQEAREALRQEGLTPQVLRLADFQEGVA